MFSVILNICTLSVVCVFMSILYIGFRQNSEVQNLSQLMYRIKRVGIKRPIKSKITGDMGTHQPYYFGDLTASDHPILIDDMNGASLEELEVQQVPTYIDFEFK